MGERDRALKLIEKVEQYKDSTNDSYLLGGIYVKKAAVFAGAKNFETSEKYYSIAIDNYSDKDSSYIADAIYFRGNQRFYRGRFLDALQDYQLASEYYENLGDKQYQFYTMASIINVYGVNGFNLKTIEERKKLIQKKIDENYPSNLYSDYYNQSLNYKKVDSIKQQESSLLKAYEIISKKEQNSIDRIIQMRIKSSISSFYSAQNNLSKSKKFLDEAEKDFKKIDKI